MFPVMGHRQAEDPVDHDGQHKQKHEFRFTPRIKCETGNEQKKVLQLAVIS
jgi:hypothetical protein